MFVVVSWLELARKDREFHTKQRRNESQEIILRDHASTSNSNIAWLPDVLYHQGRFQSSAALVCDPAGTIHKIVKVDELIDEKRVSLPRRAILPGLVNAHSHAFQRVIRGKTEYRSAQRDSFWTWRELMYSAAERLTPEDVFDASRMAFLEMALSGITAVGEFHYLHHS